jgi:CRISPR-associated protein Csx10
MTTLTLTLRQPAQLGDRPREDFVLSTLEHIPGSAVRGAFAAAWIKKNGEPSRGARDEFIRLFEGGVRFGTLLRPGTEFDSFAVIRHKYRHAESCKIADYDRATGDDNTPLNCPDCHSPLEPGRGIHRDGEKDRAEVRRRTSVAIGESGVASRGQLFTRETLRPGESFTGTLVADDPGDLAILKSLGPVRVGGRRTTHGLAEVTIAEEGGPPKLEKPNDTTLVLRLRSPGIFTDELGRPRPEPSRAELSRELGVPARVAHRWTRWHESGGWHAASGLPKPTEMAVAAGSTFLISTERIMAPAALEALARRGVGLRRHEGFGDLAGPPAIREGRDERAVREQRVKKQQDDIRPLSALLARRRDRVPEIRALFGRVLADDEDAAAQLTRYAEEVRTAAVTKALGAFLRLAMQSPEDAEARARELELL